MNTISRILNPLQRAFEAMAKARVNSVLLGMGREKVEEYGYSFEALQLGPSAWPWRKMSDGMAKENELKTAAHHLKTLVAKEPHAPLLAANYTEKTVRQIDSEQNAA